MCMWLKGSARKVASPHSRRQVYTQEMLFLYRSTACLSSTSSVTPCFSPPGPMSSPPTWDVFRCPSWRPPSGLVSACIRPFVPLCSGRAGIETLCAVQPPLGHQALELMPSPAEGHLHVTCCRSTDSPAAFSRLTGLQWLPESQTRATNCSVPMHAWTDGAVFAVAACNLFAMAIAVTSGLLPKIDDSQHSPCRTDSYLTPALVCFAALTYWEVGLAPNAGRFFMYYLIIFLIHSEWRLQSHCCPAQTTHMSLTQPCCMIAGVVSGAEPAAITESEVLRSRRDPHIC